MKTVIGDMVGRLALPPDGIDLRAELADLRSARLRQALEQSGGDIGRPARLLRMTRLDLMRLEAGVASDGKPPPPSEPTATTAAHVSEGVEFISAAAIRRYGAEGRAEAWIAKRLGCNIYLVEKVLREQTEAEIRRLDRDERLAPNAIAAKLKLPRSRVRRVLSAADAAEAAR